MGRMRFIPFNELLSSLHLGFMRIIKVGVWLEETQRIENVWAWALLYHGCFWVRAAKWGRLGSSSSRASVHVITFICEIQGFYQLYRKCSGCSNSSFILLISLKLQPGWESCWNFPFRMFGGGDYSLFVHRMILGKGGYFEQFNLRKSSWILKV